MERNYSQSDHGAELSTQHGLLLFRNKQNFVEEFWTSRVFIFSSSGAFSSKSLEKVDQARGGKPVPLPIYVSVVNLLEGRLIAPDALR